MPAAHKPTPTFAQFALLASSTIPQQLRTVSPIWTATPTAHAPTAPSVMPSTLKTHLLPAQPVHPHVPGATQPQEMQESVFHVMRAAGSTASPVTHALTTV